MDPEPVQPPPKPFSLLPVLLVLLVLFLGSTTYLAYQNMQLKKQIAVLKITPSPTPTTPRGLTANWKIYTNDKYRFSFIYPSNLALEDHQTSFILHQFSQTEITDNLGLITTAIKFNVQEGSDGQNEFLALRNAQTGIVVPEAEHGAYAKATKLENLTIDNKDAVKYRYVLELDAVIYQIKISDTQILEFSAIKSLKQDNKPDLTPVIDQILSTFKFEEPETTTYACPPTGYVDCMPILDEAKKIACSPDAFAWYKANCPDFKGGAL